MTHYQDADTYSYLRSICPRCGSSVQGHQECPLCKSKREASEALAQLRRQEIIDSGMNPDAVLEIECPECGVVQSEGAFGNDYLCATCRER